MAVGVVDEKIYVIGGSLGGRPAVGIKTVEVYNPAVDEWSEKADMPTARTGAAASAVDGKIYVVGGLVMAPGQPLAKTEIYDPENDAWTDGPDTQQRRGGPQLGVVNGKIYVIGGWLPGDRATNVLEELDTGFRPPSSVNPAGKLATTWGDVKAVQ